MKLFAYEHPSGPVHEVEVTLGDTAHWQRLRRSNALTRPRRRRDASAAPSRATAAGPPAQVQDRAGHVDFGAGIKFQASHDTLSPRRLDKSLRISTQALHEGYRGQEAAPLLPRQEIGRRRGDARDYWNRAGLHAAHPVRHGERQVGGAPKESSCGLTARLHLLYP